MLTYDFTHWSAFLTVAILINLAPAPDIMFILGHTTKGGWRSGVAAILGTWAGSSCHVVFAVAGLSAVVAASAPAFADVKWVVVAYLIRLGVQAFCSKGNFLTRDAAPASGGFRQVFRRGILVDLLNPKVAIFFLAFLPQFVTTGAGPVRLHLLVYGELIFAVATVIQPPLVLVGDRLTRHLRESRQLAL